jgi:hypothetical protein
MNWTARDFSNDCLEKAKHECAISSQSFSSDSFQQPRASIQEA